MTRRITFIAVLATAALISANALAQPPSRAPTEQDIQLPSGITLADWLSLPDVQAREPSVETGAQAAAYIRRFGASERLLGVVHRAASAWELSPGTVDASNAATKRSVIEVARKALGDWPNLTMAAARAAALQGDTAAAAAALRQWIQVALPSDRSRKEVVGLLVAQEKDPQAIARWAAQGSSALLQEVRPLPDVMKPHEALIAKAAQCQATTSLPSVDVEQVLRGQWKNFAGELRNEWIHQVQRPGIYLTNFESSGGSKIYKEGANVGNLIAHWQVLAFRDEAGKPLSNTRATTTAVSCEGTLFPLKQGNVLTAQTTIESETNNLADASYNIKWEKEQSARYEVTSGPLSAADLSQRFPMLVLPADATTRGSVYEVMLNARHRYTRLEASEAQRKGLLNQPTETSCKGVYVSVLNTFVCPGTWGEYIKEGWTLTVRELRATGR